MSLHFDAARLASVGISSPYTSTALGYNGTDVNAADYAHLVLSWPDFFRAVINVKAFQEENGVGCGGWGMDWYVLDALTPALAWCVGLLLLRYVCREPLARLGMYLGVVTENEKHHAERLARGLRGTHALSRKNAQTLSKFQNQLWLALFYIASTIFGYVVHRNKPWMGFTLSYEGATHFLLPHPHNPSQDMLVYYNYALGFYMGELVSLMFFEKNMKRSDFIEYVCHHLFTLVLIVFSHLAWMHRIGSYIILIHDASDIMLSVSKTLHYMVSGNAHRQQTYNALHKKLGDGKTYAPSFLYRYIVTDHAVTASFVCFVVGFFYFRLYCLPLVGLRTTLGMMPNIYHGTFNAWLIVYLLSVGMQALHVYWATLILALIQKVLRGGERKDIRSDNDVSDEEPLEHDAVSSAKRHSASEGARRNPAMMKNEALDGDVVDEDDIHTPKTSRVRSLCGTTDKLESMMHGNLRTRH